MMRELNDPSDLTLADFNNAKEYAGTQFDNGRFTQSVNGIPYNLEGQLSRLLREAADVIDTKPTDVEAMADVYCFLDNAQRIMPKIEAWCSVKHYGDKNPDSAWYGKTAIWSAHVTKRAAERAAAAAQKQYGDRDPFVAERAEAHIYRFERAS